MVTLSDVPTFNLKAVVQETGLKPDTLRVWERRYGVPEPARTPGGHRLYSERDIAALKWLLARKAEGLAVSRAVALWKQMLDQGEDPILAGPAGPDRPAQLSLLTGEEIDLLRNLWIDACLAYDESSAEMVLNQAFALFPPETVVMQLLQRALSQIGDAWCRGAATVQQEHFASHLALRRLDALVQAAPAPHRPGRVLVACPPAEEHTFSSLVIVLLLRRRGLQVVYLGANVPHDRMTPTLRSVRPHLVIMSAQRLYPASTLCDVAQRLRAQQIPLGYGGLIFNQLPGLRQRIPGHFLGESLDMVVLSVEQMLEAPHVVDAAVQPGRDHQLALAHYLNLQPHIESWLWEHTAALAVPHSVLASANLHLSEAIKGALRLGDMDLLGADIGFVMGILTNDYLPVAKLQVYLRQYCQATRELTDERGRLVVDWFERILAFPPAQRSSE
jgi:DNA-binding transcriptional MerR regulator/methylmalonyl-CoA mutase cobalamin-binding subunit